MYFLLDVHKRTGENQDALDDRHSTVVKTSSRAMLFTTRDWVTNRRRELDPRMFPHRTWQQRLYCETADAEANETVEIYVKPDGSHWLNCRRAKPALSPLIRHRPHPDQRIELTRKLGQIKISSCEVA